MEADGRIQARAHSSFIARRTSTMIAGNDDSIFEELLDAEVAVDMAKLQEASRLGIPAAYRGVVYRYLLGVAFMDRSSEMTMERVQEKDFETLVATAAHLWSGATLSKGGNEDEADRARAAHRPRHSTRGAADGRTAWENALMRLRHRLPYATDTTRRQCVDAVLGALRVMHSDASAEDVQVLVTLTLPLESLSTNPREVFYCTQSLFHILTHFGNVLQDDRCMQAHCGTFLMMFRAVNSALYRHFFMEGITTLEWVPALLTTLLAGRLHPDDLYRLWDVYLADVWEQLGCPLHPYVCLAVLAQMTEELIECEKMEILHRLQHLPRIDLNSILQKAVSIREAVSSKGLLG